MVDLNTRLAGAPEGLLLGEGVAISDNGAIVARGNTGLVLLVPVTRSGKVGSGIDETGVPFS